MLQVYVQRQSLLQLWRHGPYTGRDGHIWEDITLKYCSANVPLLNISPDHIIPDEFNLLLQVVDRLLRNIIHEVIEWDSEAATNGSPQNHVSKLITTINSCGVTFSIWQKENADGKSSGIYDWIS